MTDTKKTHRSAEDRIAELNAKIEGIKLRDEKKKAKADPAVRLVLLAKKSLDKALGETRDEEFQRAIDDARVGLAATLSGRGVEVGSQTPVEVVKAPAKRRGKRASAEVPA